MPSEQSILIEIGDEAFTVSVDRMGKGTCCCTSSALLAMVHKDSDTLAKLDRGDPATAKRYRELADEFTFPIQIALPAAALVWSQNSHTGSVNATARARSQTEDRILSALAYAILLHRPPLQA